jgi:hypothetical protein
MEEASLGGRAGEQNPDELWGRWLYRRAMRCHSLWLVSVAEEVKSFLQMEEDETRSLQQELGQNFRTPSSHLPDAPRQKATEEAGD